MGCVSSATPEKYEAPKGSPSPASASRSATSASPKTSPKAQSAGNRVLEENDVATVNTSGVARVIPMEGLLKDSDGDEAHEFFVEDPKTGEMRRVVSKELKKAP